MQDRTVVETQLEFYRKGDAGCLFAAHSAGNPSYFGWKLSVSEVKKTQIESIMQSAISDQETSTQSIIFPSVITNDDLKNLLVSLRDMSLVFLEQEEEFDEMMCLGYRAKVGELKSLITGFGDFSFMPKTRQAVFTEIVFRSKPRPKYDWVFKESPPDVIHLADMDMCGMQENKMRSLWYGSFDNTEKVLGHKPDLKSAARTTFAIPLSLWKV